MVGEVHMNGQQVVGNVCTEMAGLEGHGIYDFEGLC